MIGFGLIANDDLSQQWGAASQLTSTGTTTTLISTYAGYDPAAEWVHRKFAGGMCYTYDGTIAPTTLRSTRNTLTTTAQDNRKLHKAHRYNEAIYPSQAGTYTYAPARKSCSRDPIGFKGNDYNIYNYVYSNPFGHIDPSGLSSPWGPSGPAGNAGRPRPSEASNTPITIEPVHPGIPPSVPVDPGDGRRTLVGQSFDGCRFNASITSDCDGVTVTSTFTSGIADSGLNGLEIDDPSVEFESYPDCVDNRLVVSHTGYITVVVKHKVGLSLDIDLGPFGISTGTVGGTTDAKLARFWFTSGQLDCGCCE